MNKSILELYLYMNQIEPVIKWLKGEGLKTKKEVIEKLEPLIGSLIESFTDQVSKGNYGVSLNGAAIAVNKIIEHFSE